MGVLRKIRFWRGLNWLINISFAPAIIDPIRGLINWLGALPSRKSPGEVPWAVFDKPLYESKICVINTAGFYLEGQQPFDIDDDLGDATFRALPADFDPRNIRIAHAHYSHARVANDINVVLPVDRIRELIGRGILGGTAPFWYSFGFGGGLTKQYIDPKTGTAHELAKRIKAEGADFVLMVPA